MSDIQQQSFEVVAKEITIALIQNCGLKSTSLLEFACQSYDKVLKQIAESYTEVHK